MRRGDIFWAQLFEPYGHRPVVLISRQGTIEFKTSITVAAITSTIRDLPIEVQLGPDNGLPKPCVVNCSNILTIPKHWLGEKIARLSHHKISELNHSLRYALELD